MIKLAAERRANAHDADGLRQARLTWLVLVCVALPTIGCAARVSPTGRITDSDRVLESREGLASYYGRAFDGKVTASGVRFDGRSMVAAHPRYPFGTVVRVTNLRNRRSVSVRIVDRGPASGPRANGIIIDVSEAAARALGFLREGHARVRADVLRWGTR